MSLVFNLHLKVFRLSICLTSSGMEFHSIVSLYWRLFLPVADLNHLTSNFILIRVPMVEVLFFVNNFFILWCAVSYLVDTMHDVI